MKTVHANEVRSWFISGADTYDIAKKFGIPEAQVVDLLYEARRQKFITNVSKTSMERGQKRGARVAQMYRKKAVTLPKLSFLLGDSL